MGTDDKLKPSYPCVESARVGPAIPAAVSMNLLQTPHLPLFCALCQLLLFKALQHPGKLLCNFPSLGRGNDQCRVLPPRVLVKENVKCPFLVVVRDGIFLLTACVCIFSGFL